MKYDNIRRWIIRLSDAASQNCEITRICEKIQT